LGGINLVTMDAFEDVFAAKSNVNKMIVDFFLVVILVLLSFIKSFAKLS